MRVSINSRETLLQMVPKKARCAEIGVFKGSFSRKILNIAHPEKLYLIDPWQNVDDPDRTGSLYSNGSEHDMEAILVDVSDRFAEEIADETVVIQQGYSSEVLKTHAPESLDFVYIDGDHSFDSVLEDLTLAAQCLRPSGFIGLDDYFRGSWWGDGVIRAVNIFLGRHPDQFYISFSGGRQVMLRKLS